MVRFCQVPRFHFHRVPGHNLPIDWQLQKHGRPQEIFCSDDKKFGGSDVKNPAPKEVIREPFGEAPYHVLVSVPPLAGIILRPQNKEKQKKKTTRKNT